MTAIRRATGQDLPDLTALALQLWPDNTAHELAAELVETLESGEAAFFLACDGTATVGFAQCQLRHDYVEGTGTSPVGYLEGVYVTGDCRGQGLSRALLAACEAWARDMGCTEFASDCELDNAASLRFHRNVGFAEAKRIICFIKKL